MPTTVLQYKKRHKALDSIYSSWLTDYKDISDYILPRRGRFLVGDVNKGGRTNNKIINNSATMAVRTMSAGMMAGITSPARPWFRLVTTNTRLMEIASVKAYLFDVETILRAIFAKSNFYKALPVLYTELGGFGTGCMVIEEDFDNVIRCVNMTVGSYRLATNKDGIADTMYHDEPMTVQQVVDKFGLEQCSESVKSLYNSQAFDKIVNIVHVIEPRKVRDHNLATSDNMPIASLWYEKDNAQKFLRESGYEDQALIAPRWIVDSGDAYGTGPGHDTKGEVKALQIKEREKAKAIQKIVNPPMTGPTSMEGKANSVLPGHITFVDSRQGTDGFRPAYQIQVRINELNEDINESERRISRGFYEDLFLMLSQSDRRQITAREVEERHEEKLLMLGPVLERLNDEALNIAIDRTFNIANRNGLLPEPPEELQGMNLKVEYISILAQAQKAVATQGIERLAAYVEHVAGIQTNTGGTPTVLDKFDFDQSVDEYAEALGTSPKLVRSDDAVDGIRAGRKQAENAAQMAQAAQQMAATSKDLSQADTSGKNALTDLLGTSQQ